jgi:hypothetical protein
VAIAPAPLQTEAQAAIGSIAWFAVPEPRRGGLIVAQGKAAEAAALGKETPHPTSFFTSGLARLWHAKPEVKKEEILLGPQPRAALRLPGAIIISSLRDFSLARCARIVGECSA